MHNNDTEITLASSSTFIATVVLSVGMNSSCAVARDVGELGALVGSNLTFREIGLQNLLVNSMCAVRKKKQAFVIYSTNFLSGESIISSLFYRIN